MVKVERPVTPPAILSANCVAWSDALMGAVTEYGGYQRIPEPLKSSLIRHYRYAEIKEELLRTTRGKCAFCESPLSGGITIEVEHFAPKSLYPARTFEWSNLLPSCRKCNSSKADHDTVTEPIVNPYEEEPSEYFEYNCALIMTLEGCQDPDKAKRTIKVLSLNDDRLIRPRAEIFRELSIFISKLERAIDELSDLRQREARRRKALDIQDTIEIIEALTDKGSKYSAFVNYYLDNNPTYIRAKEIVREVLAA